MKESLGKVIAIIILAVVILAVFGVYILLGGGLAGVLGIQCQSYGKLVMFLLIYFILQNIIELIGKALASVLKEFEYINENNKVVQAITIIAGNIILMSCIDYFMKSIYMKDLSIIIFCAAHYFIESIIENSSKKIS